MIFRALSFFTGYEVPLSPTAHVPHRSQTMLLAVALCSSAQTLWLGACLASLSSPPRCALAWQALPCAGGGQLALGEGGRHAQAGMPCRPAARFVCAQGLLPPGTSAVHSTLTAPVQQASLRGLGPQEHRCAVQPESAQPPLRGGYEEQEDVHICSSRVGMVGLSQ